MNSLALLLAGEADVMAMDCVLHALLSWHRPTALSETREATMVATQLEFDPRLNFVGVVACIANRPTAI